MSRLTEKLKAAAEVAPRQAAKIEARADRIIAAEPGIEAQADQLFGPHEAILSEAETGMQELSKTLAKVTNGGPLELSSASPPAPQPSVSEMGLNTYRAEAEAQIAAAHKVG